MKIMTSDEVELIRQAIGDQNALALLKAISEGCEVYFFGSGEEFQREHKVLMPTEQSYCLDRFNHGEQWAGIIRKPFRPGYSHTAHCIALVDVVPVWSNKYGQLYHAGGGTNWEGIH